MREQTLNIIFLEDAWVNLSRELSWLVHLDIFDMTLSTSHYSIYLLTGPYRLNFFSERFNITFSFFILICLSLKKLFF